MPSPPADLADLDGVTTSSRCWEVAAAHSLVGQMIETAERHERQAAALASA